MRRRSLCAVWSPCSRLRQDLSWRLVALASICCLGACAGSPEASSAGAVSSAASGSSASTGLVATHLALEQVDLVVGWILVGSVMLTMTVFYLVNFPDPDIRKSTWSTLSNTCSLFCSIAIFKSLDRIIRLGVDSSDGNMSGLSESNSHRRLGEAPKTDAVSIAIGFAEMLCWFFVVEGFLYFSKYRTTQLAAWGLIGAHIVGFATLDAFYPLQMLELTRNSTLASFGVVLIAALGLTILLCIGNWMRRYATIARFQKKEVGVIGRKSNIIVVDFQDEVDDYEVNWLRQCVDSENECCAFALGFLISITVRLNVTGQVHALHWVPEDVGDGFATGMLFLYAVGFALLTLVGALVKEKVERRLHDKTHSAEEVTIKVEDENHLAIGNSEVGLGVRAATTLSSTTSSKNRRTFHDVLERVGEVTVLTLAMTTGWCLLFLGYWVFWNLTDNRGLIAEGSVMIGRLTMVFFFSMFAFFGLFITDQLADRSESCEEGLRSFGEAFVLLIGLCWESAFMQALDSLHASHASKVEVAFTQLGLTFLLCICVMPAWILYILPYSLWHLDPVDEWEEWRDSTSSGGSGPLPCTVGTPGASIMINSFVHESHESSSASEPCYVNFHGDSGVSKLSGGVHTDSLGVRRDSGISKLSDCIRRGSGVSQLSDCASVSGVIRSESGVSAVSKRSDLSHFSGASKVSGIAMTPKDTMTAKESRDSQRVRSRPSSRSDFVSPFRHRRSRRNSICVQPDQHKDQLVVLRADQANRRPSLALVHGPGMSVTPIIPSPDPRWSCECPPDLPDVMRLGGCQTPQSRCETPPDLLDYCDDEVEAVMNFKDERKPSHPKSSSKRQCWGEDSLDG